MILKLVRREKNPNNTIGDLLINDEFFCNTLEDTDRGLFEVTPLHQIQKIKVKHQTAIPYGSYKITLDVVSPRFSKKQFYIDNANGGRLPRLLNVPGFDGVLIHTGNTENDSSGCVLVGKQSGKKVVSSMDTFKKLYPKLLEAKKKGEEIIIEIV